MKLKDKPIVATNNHVDFLKYIPEMKLLNCAGVFILELKDKYVLLKNRWASYTDEYSVYRCGDDREMISIKLTDLDYDYYERENCKYSEISYKPAGYVLFDASNSQ